MSNIYVTETAWAANQRWFEPPIHQVVGGNTVFSKGDLLISVRGGNCSLSVTGGVSSYFEPAALNEYSTDYCDNTTRVNASPPVSGYFASMAEAEAATTVVGQFAVVTEPARDRGTLWVITRKPDGTFKKYPWSNGITKTVEFTDLPATVGVFAPQTPEGDSPFVNESGQAVHNTHGPVHAVSGKTVVPDSPIKPIVGSTPLTPADKNPDIGTSNSSVGFVGGGWYLSNIVSGRRSGRR